MTDEPRRLYQDIEAEISVLGAALLDQDQALRVAEKLGLSDFTTKLTRGVYAAIGELKVIGRDVSPGVILEDMGPEMVAELEISREDLDTWTVDSKAIGDPALFENLLDKLQRLRVARKFRGALRDLALADPLAADDAKRERLGKLLDDAQIQLGSLFSLNGGPPDIKSVELGDAIEGRAAEKIPWVLQGWLAERDIAMLAGDSGAGKSWVLLDLAFALVMGEDWLGTIKNFSKVQRVLYVDEEQNERLVRHRIKLWANARGLESGLGISINFRYLVENGLNLDDDLGWRRLFRTVEEFRPDWILLDTLVRFHNRNENDNSQISQFFQQRLKPLAASVDSGLIALHHFGKPSKEKGDSISARLRGASDLKAHLDELWGIEEDEESGGRILSHEKTRWGSTASPLMIELEDTRDGAHLVCTGKADDCDRAILEELEEAGTKGVLRKKLVKAVAEQGLKAASKAFGRHDKVLRRQDKIARRKEGRAYRYWLSFLAPEDAGDD